MVQKKKIQQQDSNKKQQQKSSKKQQQKSSKKQQEASKKKQKLLPKVEDEFRRFPFFKTSGVILLICLIGLIVFLIIENKA